jgi:hypothetical protein
MFTIKEDYMLNRTKKSGRKIYSLVITIALVCLMTAAIIPGVMGTATFVELGEATHYAILAESGITQATVLNNAITGDIGNPTGAQIGVTCPEMNGGGGVMGSRIFATDAGGPIACRITDALVNTAIANRQTAFTNANGQVDAPIILGAAEIGGLTLVPGIYKTGTAVTISTDVTLDAQGDPNGVWIFQIGQGLTTSANTKVILNNGAQPKNIFWVPSGNTQLGATSVFNGNILAGPGTATIALLNGAKLNGRALTGKDVTLINNLVTIPTDSSVLTGPNITSLSPTAGATTGATSVIITGSGFTGATSVKFDGIEVTSKTVNSDTQITVTPPAHIVGGPYSVVVITPVGTATKTNAYTYAPAPTFTSIAPASGPNAGSTVVTITGSGFTGATSVTFGGTAATAFTVNTDTQITATTPLHATGIVNVVVTTPVGTATGSGVTGYTYVAPPTFTSITPNSGSTVGGTSVTIVGTNFVSGGSFGVTIGGTAATGVSVTDSTHIAATTPAGTAGAKNVVITNNDGQTVTGSNVYTYVTSAPTISSISPSSGSTAGGTIVIISGTGLTTTTGVTIDGLAVAYTVVGTTVRVTTAAHTVGSVNIVVTTPLGTATGSGATGYTYGSATTVNLGTADNFVILSKAGITDVPTSDIRGNIGTSPITGASITGLGCPEVTGTIYTVDATGPACRVINPTLLGTAVSDMETAYNDAAGRTPTDYLNAGTGGDLAGLTLAPGVYTFNGVGNVKISSDVTLSGNANDVWIFQIPGTLDISSGKQVILSGGAQKKNIYWQVAGVTTLGTTSVFEGTILSKTKIALLTGATLNGKALAQTEVTLDSNKINVPAQAPAPVADIQYDRGDTSVVAASPVASGQLAPVLPSLVTPIIGAGSLVSKPFIADITGMPGVAVSWATVIDDSPATDAKITTAIQPNVDESTLNKLTAELNRGGLDIRDLVYGMVIQQTGTRSLSPTHISMSAPQSWVTLNGGRDNIMIIGIASDGTTEVLNTWYDGYDPTSGYLVFKATSIQSGLGTSYWLVSVKPYTPAPATVSIEQVTVPISSTATPVSSTVPGTVQMAPTQVPATTTSTSTGIPIILVGGFLAALVLIGVGVMTYTRRNKGKE